MVIAGVSPLAHQSQFMLQLQPTAESTGTEMMKTHKKNALPFCFVATFAFKRVKIALARDGLAPQGVGTKGSCDW